MNLVKLCILYGFVVCEALQKSCIELKITKHHFMSCAFIWMMEKD